MTQLVWPNGSIDEPVRSDGYGPRQSIQTKEGPTRPFHVGTDHIRIGKVCSIGDGTVIESGKYDHVAWAGYQILIYLGEIDGTRTWVRMCHFQGHPPQSRGDTVCIGDFVGLEGNTGQSVGRHLHWEIYRGSVNRGSGGNPGSTVDPREFVAAYLSPPYIEQEPIMAVYLRATGNSSPIDAKNPGSSRIWAGPNRLIDCALYSDVWERSDDGSVRRLFPGEWAAIQAAYKTAGRIVPLADISGNELEKMYLVKRTEPKR